MATKKISDSVGKKIVEALKMQSPDSAIEDFANDDNNQNVEVNDQESIDTVDDNNISEDSFIQENSFASIAPTENMFNMANESQSIIDNAFNNSLSQNLGSAYTSNQVSFEYPANVAILNGLIGKLPTGVSKQTGALIIRQTMEALGISMQSVIEEAKQVQQDLASRARECQKNILDYRKQISILEQQAQQYQRQAVSMNDIIGLFVKTK